MLMIAILYMKFITAKFQCYMQEKTPQAIVYRCLWIADVQF